MNRWASHGIFRCVKHGKQVKLEELEGSSFAYKDCHSEFEWVVFFTQKLLHDWKFASGFCMWVHFLPNVAFGLQRGGLEELRQLGDSAMLVILPILPSPWLVAGGFRRKKKQLVIHRLLQERHCISFCSFCWKKARKKFCKRRRRKKSIALPYPDLMMAQNTYWGGQTTHKKTTIQLCLGIE